MEFRGRCQGQTDPAIHPTATFSSRRNIMLVLSRRENQSIVIDGQIKVTIVRINGDKIRLGIEAPRNVAVWREELVASIDKPEMAVA